MAKPWEELVQEDTFQKLNDEQKELVRNNYFQMEIAPKIPEGYDPELVRKNFDDQTKTTDLEYRQKKYTEEHGVFERMGMQLKAGLRETSASAAASGLANIEDQLAELEETEQDIKDWEAGKPYHPESYEAQLDPDVARKVMMDKRERVAKKREQLETRKRQAIHRMQWQSKAAREIPQEPVAEAVAQSKTLDEAMEKLSVAPGGAVLGLGFRSAPNMILPMVTAAVFKVPFAGARTITAMKAGKEVVETVKHPLGPIAFALGMGSGSFTVERGAALQEGLLHKLKARGVDIKNEDAMYEALGDPGFYEEILQDANMRAGYIAMMDLVGGAALTKNLMPDSMRRGLAKEMAEVTAQLPIQAGTEMLGELTAQYAVDGEIRAGEVLAEGIGSLVSTPGEYATAVLTGVREGQEQRLADLVEKNEALKKRRDELNAKAEEYRTAEEEGATDLEMEARRDELVEDTNKYMNDVNAAWDKYESEQQKTKAQEEEAAYRQRELQAAGLEEPSKPKPAMAPKPTEPTPATETGITKAIEREVAKREKTAELVPTPTQEGPMQKAMREAMERKKSEIEQAAAAVETEPTEAQKEAGTYKKGHVSLQGLPIAIETPKGANRTGKDEDGNEWSTQLQDHYGYVKRTEGADGDHVDVFVSDNAEAADRVFVVNQNDPNTGQFDEHKVVIGPTTPEEAQQVYQRNYDEGWNGFDSAVEMTIPEFKAWLKTDTNKPVQQADVAALPTKPAMAARGEAVAEPKLRRGAKKKAPGLYTYNGYEIERMESGQWNMRPEGTDTWTDAAASLSEAQDMADRFAEQAIAAPKLRKGGKKKEVYYHGTNAQFDKFREGKEGVAGHFTVEREEAAKYGKRVVQVELDFENPVTIMDEDWRMLRDKPELLARLKKQGYDAAISDDTGDVIVFNADDINIIPEEGQITLEGGRVVEEKGKFKRRELAKTKEGKYLGVPQWIKKAADIAKLRTLLRKLAREGEVGRMWYENSGKRILEIVGGVKKDAEVLAQLIAIYSPQNSIFPNMTQAVQAYYMWKSGVPKEQFIVRPMGHKDKETGELKNTLDDKATELLYDGKPWEGRKTNSFYQNLMTEIDPTGGHVVTADMWMARAFGYINDSISSGIKEGANAYSFIENEIMDIAKELGWTPHQAQAAIWVAIKARHELADVKAATIEESVAKGYSTYDDKGKWKAPTKVGDQQKHRQIWRKHALKGKLTAEQLAKAKYDFNDAVADMLGKISWEALPSVNVDTLKGIMDAPLEQRIEYQIAMGKALTDSQGNDIIAKQIGLLTGEEMVGPGIWEGFVGAGAQKQVIVPKQRKTKTKEPIAQEEAARLMDLYTNILGLVLQQDGVSWHRPFYTTTVKDSNGMDFQLGRPISYEEAAYVAEIVHDEIHPDIAIIPTEGGVRFLNFPDSTSVDNKTFHGKIVDAIDQVFGDTDIQPEHRRLGTDGNMADNNWTENSYGEEYRQRLLEAGGRDLLGWVDSTLAPRVQRVNERFAKKYGWGQDTRQAAPEKPGSLASPVPLSRLADPFTAQQEIYGRFGFLQTDADTTESLKVYDLDELIENPEKLDALLNEYGFEVKYFSFHEDEVAGVEFTIPKFKKENYQTGVVWIYDPRVAHGSFKDEQYTRSWRIVHELGHAITERLMQKRYGDSRREGRMGRTWDAIRGKPSKRQVTVELDPLTLNHAQRAVEWEDVSFRVQRMLMEDMGIEVAPADFGREYNTNIADAIHRVLTGDFGDPGEYGFVPRETIPPLKSIMKMLEATEKAMAKEQGREPTKGIDLTKWERISQDELRAEMNRMKKTEPRLRRGGEKGVSPQELVNHMKQLTSRWKGAQNISVVADYTKLPVHLKNYIEQQNAQDEADGIFDTVTGNIYLIANNIKSTDQATKIIFHEALGHGGLRAVFGDDIAPFLRNLYAAKKDDELMAKIIVDYGLDMRRPDDRIVAAEEWLAITQESLPKDTWVRQLISFIKQWFRKLAPGLKVTDAEIYGALGRMRGQVINGGPLWRQAIETLPMFSRASDPFYSQMEVHLTANLPNKGTAQSYIDMIKGYDKRGKIKSEELEWSGLIEWLEGQEGKIEKQAILDYVAANKIEVQEEFNDFIDGMTILKKRFSVIEDADDGRWYWYENGEPVRHVRTGEHVSSFSEEDAWENIEYDYLEDEIPGGTKYHGYQMGGGENYREARLILPASEDEMTYQSKHWDEPNVIAHIRMNERVDDQGNRVLFIEEIQSDWHQEGRKKGYGKPGKPKWRVYNPVEGTHEIFTKEEDAQAFKKEMMKSGWGGGEMKITKLYPQTIPDAPFKTSWPLLAFKRMIRYAAEHGFDKIAWTTGDIQVERYDLSKQLKQVSFTKDEGEVHLTAFDHNGNNVLGEVVAEDELSDYVGKELADKIIAYEYPEGEFTGLDLKIGGEGMMKFYDSMLPNIVNKYVKKWGAKVDKVSVAGFDGLYPANQDWWAAGYTGQPFETMSYIEDDKVTVINKFTKEEKDFPNRQKAEDYIARQSAIMVAKPQHGITVTDEMRTAALQGQPMLSRGTERPEASDRNVQDLAEENEKTFTGWARGVIDKMDRKINGFSELVDLSSYLEHRGRLQALIQQGQDTARSLYNTFKDLSEVESLNVFEYLTDRDTGAGIIENEEIRAEAIKAKRLINAMGRMMVEQGIIPEQSYQNYESRYLPRVYLAYLMGDKAIKTIGTGKKLSKQGYAKRRNEGLTAEYREVVLGEIKDPAFLISRAIGIPSRDLAIMEFFEKIMLNPNWVLQDQLVEIDIPGTNVTRNVTPFWLANEASRLRAMAVQLKEGDQQRVKMERLAAQYEELASRASMDKQFDVTQYKQIPDTPQYGVLRGLIVKKAIYDDIAESGASLQDNPDAWMKLFGQGGTGTKITQLWKVMKVSLNPPAQVRNLVSNWVLLNLSGVPIHKMPYYLGRAVGELRRGVRGEPSVYYDIAKEFGITAGTFSANELAQIEREFLNYKARNKGKMSITGLMDMASFFIEKAGNIYQHAEVLSKVAKIMHEVETKGTDPALAAQEANKWLFDYSAISEFIRTARNAPIGIPFLTFYMKVLPRLLEVAATAPWRFVPYYLMLKGMAMAVAAVNDVDEDDGEALKEALPQWLRERGHAVIWPWKDQQGRWAAMNLGYFFPWTAWTDLAQDAGEISKSVVTGQPFEARNILQGSGVFGSPLANLISASMTNIDPFTRKEIVRDGDLPYQQMLSRFGYLYQLMVPPWMTSGSPAVKMYKAGTGWRDRWGNPQPTLSQATARWFGVNIYPIEPERTRSTNLIFMKRDLDDIKSRMKFELKDPNLSADERRKLRENYREQLRYKQAEMKRYKELSKVHPNLK